MRIGPARALQWLHVCNLARGDVLKFFWLVLDKQVARTKCVPRVGKRRAD